MHGPVCILADATKLVHCVKFFLVIQGKTLGHFWMYPCAVRVIIYRANVCVCKKYMEPVNQLNVSSTMKAAIL